MTNPWKQYSKLNPQRENGNRQIASDVFHALMSAELSGSEFRVVMAIIDKTWGFNKESDCISSSQLMDMTGLAERTIKESIKILKEKRVIFYAPSNIRGRCGSPLNEFIFNKHYDTWKTQGCRKVHGCTVVSGKGEQTRKPRVRRSAHTIETLTKETTTKENKDIVEIISYLNQKTGKKFTHKAKATTGHIKARLSEGRSVDDFKTVIDNKCAKWLHDPKMTDYLRPETLFGTKFEAYINERPPEMPGVSDKTRQTIEAGKRWLEKHEGSQTLPGEHGDP